MKFALTAVLALAANQAQALSCMRTTPIDAFTQAQAATEAYVVLLGRAAIPNGALPQGREGDVPARPVIATFKGMGLGPDGFTVPFDGSVTLISSCAGPWCGSMPSGDEVMAFAQVDGSDTVIDLSPCGQWVFTDPTAEMINDVTTCLNAGCTAQPLQ